MLPDGECRWGGRVLCSMTVELQAPTCLFLGVTLLYGLMYFVYLARASLQLQRRLYQRFRVLHIWLQLQV